MMEEQATIRAVMMEEQATIRWVALLDFRLTALPRERISDLTELGTDAGRAGIPPPPNSPHLSRCPFHLRPPSGFRLAVALAEAVVLGRHLHELVLADELNRVLQRQLAGRRYVL